MFPQFHSKGTNSDNNNCRSKMSGWPGPTVGNGTKLDGDGVAKWLRSPISGDLLELPQCGPACAGHFRDNGISTTYGLFGKFLSLKEEGVGSVELCDRFYYWLGSIGIPPGSKGTITHAVAVKLEIHFPGIYDADAYR